MFSVKNQWQIVGPVHVTRGEGGFGFTLRGDSPVLIAAVIPGGQAEVRASQAPTKSLGYQQGVLWLSHCPCSHRQLA